MNGIDAISGFKHRVVEATKHRRGVNKLDHLNKEMLIIGMSAGTLNDDMAGAFMKGMHYFLHKPVKRDQLITILKIKKNSVDLDSARDELDDMSHNKSVDNMLRQKPQKRQSIVWDAAWSLLNYTTLFSRRGSRVSVQASSSNTSRRSIESTGRETSCPI